MRKTALVTGAAKGIGRSIALALGRAGYSVAVNYHSREDAAKEVVRSIRECGVDACMVYADLGVVDDINRMYDEVLEKFGHLDLVVNNAGISSEVYFLDASESDFDRMTAIDWKGLYFSSQIAAKSMIARGTEGVIVNISSNQVFGCWPRATIYGPTKAAVDKFTKNCAMELALHNIRMVAVAPGYTDVGWDRESHLWDAEKKLPLRRFASPDEIANAVVFLASDDAKYITGCTLPVDGAATLPVVACNDFLEE